MTTFYVVFCRQGSFLKPRPSSWFMSHQGNYFLEGIVLESLPNAMFRVQGPQPEIILAHVSGKMRRNFVRILVGDKVRVEMTPYDKERGRIVYRYR